MTAPHHNLMPSYRPNADRIIEGQTLHDGAIRDFVAGAARDLIAYLDRAEGISRSEAVGTFIDILRTDIRDALDFAPSDRDIAVEMEAEYPATCADDARPCDTEN